MRRLASSVLGVLLASTAFATVYVHVYRADEKAPLQLVDPNIPDVYRDIMVGTRLTLFVISDAAMSFWSGGLRISWDDWNRGTVEARGYNEDTFRYEDSILPASGEETFLDKLLGDSGITFSMNADLPEAGRWFVLDYCAKAPGACTVGVYAPEASGEQPPDFDPDEGEPPPTGYVWTQALSFNHVPSQDHNGDSRVDFVDFALWAPRWRENTLSDPNAPDPNAPTPPAASDPDEPYVVDARELALFCAFWLEQTDANAILSDPNAPEVW